MCAIFLIGSCWNIFPCLGSELAYCHCVISVNEVLIYIEVIVSELLQDDTPYKAEVYELMYIPWDIH